jgi:hypothetical protein
MESKLSIGGSGIMCAIAVIEVRAVQRRELESIVARPSEGGDWSDAHA